MDGARFFSSPTTTTILVISGTFTTIIIILTVIIIAIAISATIISATISANLARASRIKSEQQDETTQKKPTTTTTTRLNVIDFASKSADHQGQQLEESKSVVVIREANNMIAKLAETSSSTSTSGSSLKFMPSATKDAPQSVKSSFSSNSSTSKKNESSSKRKRAKLLDQLLQTNWSKQSQQASNLMKLNKMLLVCDANFLEEKSAESPLSLAISSAQINNASHQMLFTSISSQSQSQSSSSQASCSTSISSISSLQCQVPVHGLGRLELISLQQAGITELIQSKAPLIQRILLLLIKSGALIDFRNSDGRTPLHVAATKSNYWALKTLLDLGASTDYRDINGLTPLYYSILQKADLKVTQLLLNHNRSPTNHYGSFGGIGGGGSMTTQLSADRGRVIGQPSAAAVAACTGTGTTDDHGWQEVHQACKLGLDAHLEALIYYGCDIDAKISGSGNTPLHVAAINDQLNCAKVLLMRGADKTITNNSHQTAHQVAVVSGNMDLAEFIAQHNDSMMVPFRNNDHAPLTAQKPSIITSTNVDAVVGRPTEERAFAMFSSRSSANIRSDAQQQQQSQAQKLQPQQRHMSPLSLDVFAPPTTNPAATTAAASSSGSSSNTTNSSNQSLLSIGGNRNQSQQFNSHVNNISPCLSQRSCATSNTTTSSGVCCDGDGNQSNEEQQHSKLHLSNSHSQHSNVTIISIKNGATVDSSTTAGYGGRKSLRTGGGDDDDLRSSSDDGNSNGSSSSCADDLYSLMSEQRPLFAGTIVEAVSEYQSGDPNHLQLRRGDLIEVLDYTPELLNAGQLPRLANKPMIFGRRLSDSLAGLFPSFCVHRTKHKNSNQKLLRDTTNIDPSILDSDSNTQWPTIHDENSRPLSESQSMASLDSRSESSFGFGKSVDDPPKMRFRELNVTLTKNNNGFGFVLRGAKIDSNSTLSSNNSSLTGNDQSNNSLAKTTIIDERMMAANNLISLQYLDEIEPTSAAHQAGLRRGDFLIAVNGQDVRRSSHEQVVHMIRQSGNQVQLTIATPISQMRSAGNQQPTYMSRTLTRSKPEPPRRDPTTTLTRNRTQRVKSMLVQPQRQVQNLFDADKPLPYAPGSDAPLSPSGSLNIGRSVSVHLAHFNSVQSLASSSVIDTQSITSISTLSADQQQSDEISTSLPESLKQTPTYSSSSTTTLTTIAGIKPKTPPKPNLSQLPTSESQQAIYQPAVITTTKRPSPQTTPPKVQSSAGSAPPMPPPPPPLPNFSIATPQLNNNRLFERRTSAPLNQLPKDSINQNRLMKKRESVATIGHHTTPDATEMGAVAAACAAAANSRLQRQLQMQKQSEEVPQIERSPSATEGSAEGSTKEATKEVKQVEQVTPAEIEALKEPEVELRDKGVEPVGALESVPTEIVQQQSERRSSLSHRQVAAASLGRKSSAQIIQQPKQVASHSQTLRARPKPRPSIPDYNELPPPPPPLPSSSEMESNYQPQRTSYVELPMQQTHLLNRHHNHLHADQIDLDRQQAYAMRLRDDSNMSLNNKEEFVRKQHQQELVKQQQRQQQLLLQQQQLKIQQRIQLQHQKCCVGANHQPHEHHHGTMRYGGNSAPRVSHNQEYSQQTHDLLQMKQMHPALQAQPQAMVVNKTSAHHHSHNHNHHHHGHNLSHHNHHSHNHSHHHQQHNNYADSSTMPAGLQQRQQLHHHHHQKPNDHLQHDVYQQHPLHAQTSIMLNHNNVQQQQHQLQQHYYQQLQQQQMLADRYMVYAPDNYSAMNTRDS